MVQLGSNNGIDKTYEGYDFITLTDASKYCDYSQEYLSLLARQKKLKAKKIGRNWYTKKEWLAEYIIEHPADTGSLLHKGSWKGSEPLENFKTKRVVDFNKEIVGDAISEDEATGLDNKFEEYAGGQVTTTKQVPVSFESRLTFHPKISRLVNKFHDQNIFSGQTLPRQRRLAIATLIVFLAASHLVYVTPSSLSLIKDDFSRLAQATTNLGRAIKQPFELVLNIPKKNTLVNQAIIYEPTLNEVILEAPEATLKILETSGQVLTSLLADFTKQSQIVASGVRASLGVGSDYLATATNEAVNKGLAGDIIDPMAKQFSEAGLNLTRNLQTYNRNLLELAVGDLSQTAQETTALGVDTKLLDKLNQSTLVAIGPSGELVNFNSGEIYPFVSLTTVSNNLLLQPASGYVVAIGQGATKYLSDSEEGETRSLLVTGRLEVQKTAFVDVTSTEAAIVLMQQGAGNLLEGKNKNEKIIFSVSNQGAVKATSLAASSLQGGVISGGNLNLTGQAKVKETLTAGRLVVSGASELKDFLTVARDATFAANAIINGNLMTQGLATFASGASVAGALQVTGEISTGVLKVAGPMSATSGSFSEDLRAQNLITTGNVIAGGSLTGQTLNIAGTAIFTNLGVASMLSVGQGFSVGGSTILSGDTTTIGVDAGDIFIVNSLAQLKEPVTITKTLNVTGTTTLTNLSVSGTTSFTQLTTPYQQVKTVALAGGDYATITAALTAITDATASKRYLVRVMPGIYTETVAMKEYVDIVGASGAENVTIKQVDANVVTASDNAILSGVTVSVTAATAARTAIIVADKSPSIKNVNISYDAGTAGTGVSVTTGSPILEEVVMSGASLATGLSQTGAGGATLRRSTLTATANDVSVTGGTFYSSYNRYLGTANNLSNGAGATIQSADDIYKTTSLAGTFLPYSFGSTPLGKAPALLLQPQGTTSWDTTTATYLGVNAALGFTGNLVDAQLAGVSKFKIDYQGNVTLVGATLAAGNISPSTDNTYSLGTAALRWKDLALGPASLKIYSTTGVAGAGANYTLGNFGFTGDALTIATTNTGTGVGGQINLTSAYPIGNTTNSAFNLTSTVDLGVADEILQVGDSAGTFVTILGNGNVGINTVSPDRKLDVLDASNPQIRLTYTDGSVYTDLQTTSGGGLTITPTATASGVNITSANTSGTGATASLSVTGNSLTTGAGFSVASSSLTSGSLVALSSTSTAAASNTQTVLNVATSGINGTAGQTTYGGYFTNTHAGATSTNVGLYASASGGTNNYAAIFENGNVGIGTSSPRTRLELGNDGAMLAIGTFGSGWTEPDLGAGARMLWYPRKAAFRAGDVDGTQWNNANIGNYSTAMGQAPTASGSASTAMGYYTIASGARSTAMGDATTASGSSSTAMGSNTTASGIISTAMGYGVTASGTYSTAMGAGTTASGARSTATGDATTADSYNSFVLGRYNIGGGTAGSWVATDALFEIGIGTSGVAKANALTVLKNGNVGIGTTGPDRKLDVLDASNPQIRLTQADGTVYTDLQNTTTSGLILTGSNLTSTSGTDLGYSATRSFVADGGAGGNTATPVFLNLAPTVNLAATGGANTSGYTGIKLNVTETAIGSGTKNLLDLQVATASKFSVSNTGAIVGVGLNAGSGLIQGTGGFTLTGTTNINATGTAATNLGNSTGILTLTSGGASGWNNTSGDLTLQTTTTGDLILNPASGNINIAAGDDILALGANSNLGSAGIKFNTLYIDTVQATTLVGVIAGGATNSEDWTINSDNASADAELMNIIFERGTTIPNALITWDNTNDEFDVNSNLHITGTISSAVGVQLGGTTIDVTTDAGEALAVQPGNLTTGSGTGGALNLSGGNESGLTSVGGAVNINAGIGTSTDGAINIGTTTGSAVNISKAGITTTVNGALTVAQLLTGQLGATITGATVNLNASSNFATNINTGTSTGTVSIGNSLADVAIVDPQWSVTGAGAAVFVGLNAGSGLIQGTGGLTITGTANLNATGTAATNLGNSTGVLVIASGGTSSWTNTSGNLTIQTATSGTTTLDSAGILNLGTVNSTATNLGKAATTLTVNPTAWTATPTISGLITATSGLTSNGTVTVQNNSAFSQTGVGTFGTGTGAVSLNGDTTIAAGKNLALASGAGTFTQTFTGTTTTAATLTGNSLTTGSLLNLTSTNNSGANTAWSANQFNVTNLQGTTAVSTGSIAGWDLQFTQNTSIAGNTETAARIALKQNDSATTDQTVASLLSLENNDTAIGNQITVTDGLKITGTNLTNGLNLSGTFGTNLITSSNFTVSQAGAIVGVGLNAGSGLIQGTGGLTITGTTNLNATGTGATNLGNSTGVLVVASGGTSSWTNTSGNLTIQTATSGTTTLDSAGILNLGTVNSTATNLGKAGTTLTVNPTSWTATPTISGLITASGGLTIAANQNLTLNSGTGQYSQTYTGTTTNAATITANSLTTGNALNVSSSSITGGSLVNLASTATSVAFDGQKILNISSSGTGSSYGPTTYGVYVDNGNGSSGSVSIGGYFKASGGVTRYAGIFNGGWVGIGTDTPSAALETVANVVTPGYGQTTYAAKFIDNLATSGPDTNIAAYFSATGADTNYAGIFENGNVGIGTVAPGAKLEVVQTATATGALKGIIYTGAVNTNQTLSTEIPSLTLTTAGRQWATGALTAQREVLITQPTYSFVGASTITDAATVGIAGAPIAGTFATLTNSHGLLIQAGAVAAGTLNSYGLTVNTQTGGTNNYAAAFLGGNVGIGTTAPGKPLDVVGDIRASTGFFDSTAGDPGGTGLFMPYLASTPNSGPTIRWTDGTLTNTFGFFVQAGLNFQGNASNGNFIIKTPTSNGTLGTTVINLGGLSTSEISYFNGGNVGIGTTGPDRKLDVLDASNPQIRLTQADGTVYTDLQTNSSGYLNITASGGRVGIGVANPATSLDVSGTINASTNFTLGALTAMSANSSFLSVGSGFDRGIQANWITAGPVDQVKIANLFSLSSTTGTVAGKIWGMTGQTANIFEVSPYGGTTKFISVSNLGALTFNPTLTTGTIMSVGTASATALTGSLTGQSLDLSTNYTATGQSVTGYSATLPAVTNVGAGTYAYKGLTISGGALVQNTLAGTNTWTGLDINMPAITQTTGTVTSTGLKITGGTVTSGTAYALTTDANAGNVGIGTTGPDRKLDVLDASNPQIRLTQADGTVYTDLQTTSSGYLNMIASGSRVGIDTASPGAKFEITGGTQTTSLPLIKTTQTWNSDTAVFTGITGTFTDGSAYGTATAAHLASNILDLTTTYGSFKVNLEGQTAITATRNRNTTDNFYGLTVSAQPAFSNNTMVENVGGKFTAQNGPSSNSYTNAYGLQAYAINANGVATTNLYGIHTKISLTGSSNTTNAYGAYIDTAVDSGAGAITNVYGLYLANQTVGSTLNYGLYSAGDYNSFTSGNVSGTGTTAALSVVTNSLTTGNALSVASSSLTTGNLVALSSTSTAAASNTQTVLNVATSGINSTSGQITYGAQFSNTHSPGAGSSTNVALYATATTGTNNYSAIFDAGNVGIGTVTPTTGRLAVAQTDAANLEAVYIDTEESTNTQAVFSIESDSTVGSGADTLHFKITADGSVYSDANVYSTPADIAEMYNFVGQLEEGDVVEAVNISGALNGDNFGVQKAVIGSGRKLMGVISSKPGPVLGYDWKRPDILAQQKPVALAGRVPVKIDPGSESIEVGDYLTASIMTGRAAKATTKGWVVGKALENWQPGMSVDKITVLMNLTFYDPENNSVQIVQNLGVQGVLNVTGQLQINGQDINSAGTLSNVAYLSANNQFWGQNNFKSLFQVSDESGKVVLSAGGGDNKVKVGADLEIGGSILAKVFLGTALTVAQDGDGDLLKMLGGGEEVVSISKDGSAGFASSLSVGQLHNADAKKGDLFVTRGITILAEESYVDTLGQLQKKNLDKAIAQVFDSEQPIEAGKVVALDGSDIGLVKEAMEIGSEKLVGVTTLGASIEMGAPTAPTTNSQLTTTNAVKVATSGIVMVKVTSAGGEIKPGDILTSSVTTGLAQKASVGVINTLGIALKPFACSAAQQPTNNSQQTTQNSTSSCVGEVPLLLQVKSVKPTPYTLVEGSVDSLLSSFGEVVVVSAPSVNSVMTTEATVVPSSVKVAVEEWVKFSGKVAIADQLVVGKLAILNEVRVLKNLRVEGDISVRGDLAIEGAITLNFWEAEPNTLQVGDAVAVAGEKLVRRTGNNDTDYKPAIGLVAKILPALPMAEGEVGGGGRRQIRVAISGVVKNLKDLQAGAIYFLAQNDATISTSTIDQLLAQVEAMANANQQPPTDNTQLNTSGPLIENGNTARGLTSQSPSESGQMVQVLGVARSQSEFVIMPSLQVSMVGSNNNVLVNSEYWNTISTGSTTSTAPILDTQTAIVTIPDSTSQVLNETNPLTNIMVDTSVVETSVISEQPVVSVEPTPDTSSATPVESAPLTSTAPTSETSATTPPAS